LEQDFDTIAPFTIEEAYEVADAIKKRDFSALKEELGDLIFQVAFHARMAEEANMFDFVDVVNGLNKKMIARHEHVFGANEIATPAAVLVNWENLKAEERAAKLSADKSVLADVAITLPALSRAWKLSKRAARVGFDWENLQAIFDKLTEEVNETREAIESADVLHITEEIGDCLFVLVNLARKCAIDPENALRLANDKFEKRFRFIEAELANQGKSPQDSTIDEMESLWLQAKIKEK
jgi:tetrapyrrole methylase family protein/MazG family protein/ATP diphosphatase